MSKQEKKEPAAWWAYAITLMLLGMAGSTYRACTDWAMSF